MSTGLWAAVESVLESCFDPNGRLILKRLEEVEEFDGNSCIFSTHPLPKAEFVRLYFDKDTNHLFKVARIVTLTKCQETILKAIDGKLWSLKFGNWLNVS